LDSLLYHSFAYWASYVVTFKSLNRIVISSYAVIALGGPSKKGVGGEEIN